MLKEWSDSNRNNRCKAVLTRSRYAVIEKAAEASYGAAVTALFKQINRDKIAKKTGHRNTVFLL